MASNLLKLPSQTFKPPNPFNPVHLSNALFKSVSIPSKLHTTNNFSLFPQFFSHKSKVLCVSLHSSLSSFSPPSSKEEAILQAKTCLSTILERPLNNPRLAGKLKKQKQPRLRVEIPIIDEESADSLIQLAIDVFGDLPIKRKGTKIKILLLWPNSTLTNFANNAVSASLTSNPVENIDISTFDNDNTRVVTFADIAVFLAPEISQLEAMKMVSDDMSSKPVVVFNPKWSFDEESSFGELSGFVGSFEVVYSILGLEVQGILSKRRGVVFKYVRDGVLSGEKWGVWVEEEGGDLKVISRFKKRPSIGEVENVLYNLMAVNSPITKSAKIFIDLVSNVTGKK
ncbi:hypothetical protein GIB67_039855 [Kingdonia uniflora]|uniref:DUF1995 domain-containing protein n=1 Tax=Kingdonia uniflora TaxID=39325 RepID=A0A7J7P444_9MAGN|nr:hypothetical protein GIB67_039855 [Kingdonia uniflora]